MEKLPPIIPSVWTIGQRDAASVSAHPLIHVAGARLGSVAQFVEPLKRAQKRFWVHADMIAGLKMDREGLSVLNNLIAPASIVTSNLALARVARSMNKSVVLRVFIHDSQSLESSVSAIDRIRPDIVCCMPAVAFPFVNHEIEAFGIPIVVAGLVRTASLRDNLLKLGISVEIGNANLW